MQGNQHYPSYYGNGSPSGMLPVFVPSQQYYSYQPSGGYEQGSFVSPQLQMKPHPFPQAQSVAYPYKCTPVFLVPNIQYAQHAPGQIQVGQFGGHRQNFYQLVQQAPFRYQHSPYQQPFYQPQLEPIPMLPVFRTPSLSQISSSEYDEYVKNCELSSSSNVLNGQACKKSEYDEQKRPVVGARNQPVFCDVSLYNTNDLYQRQRQPFQQYYVEQIDGAKKTKSLSLNEIGSSECYQSKQNCSKQSASSKNQDFKKRVWTRSCENNQQKHTVKAEEQSMCKDGINSEPFGVEEGVSTDSESDIEHFECLNLSALDCELSSGTDLDTHSHTSIGTSNLSSIDFSVYDEHVSLGTGTDLDALSQSSGKASNWSVVSFRGYDRTLAFESSENSLYLSDH